jgi:hypothetical protein
VHPTEHAPAAIDRSGSERGACLDLADDTVVYGVEHPERWRRSDATVSGQSTAP